MSSRHRLVLAICCLFLAAAAGATCLAGPDSTKGSRSPRLEVGKELFTREWQPGDKRSFAGDGLGPVHNARSCVACHDQGGIGGSGRAAANSIIVSAFVDRMSQQSSILEVLFPVPAMQPDRDKLAAIDPALRTHSSFTLHRFPARGQLNARDMRLNLPADTRTRCENEAKIGEVTVDFTQSERNTPALFGIGLIDRIPANVLEQVAVEQSARSRESLASTSLGTLLNGLIQEQDVRDGRQAQPITGRVARLQNGKIGRFGWKASVASLHEFTLQACSNELGLEVPGVHRPAPANGKNYRAPGLDLSQDQCECLTEFIRNLPKPIAIPPQTAQHVPEITAGRNLFASMGCAECHRPRLGDVDGIFSDLLLHDMGLTLGGSGGYATSSSVEFVKVDGEAEPLPVVRNGPEIASRPTVGAGPREWRTPPLWGLRDSAPYLHDGRADTIEDAIKLHDGEGALAARAFEKLTPRERMQLDMFLKSLAAPGSRP
jgi:CxxC motif-containing protein (DUF1111 family)